MNLTIMWNLYIIEKKNRYYTGIAANLKKRLNQHNNPVLLYCETFENKFQAAKREKEIKGWARRKKKELIDRFSKVSLP